MKLKAIISSSKMAAVTPILPHSGRVFWMLEDTFQSTQMYITRCADLVPVAVNECGYLPPLKSKTRLNNLRLFGDLPLQWYPSTAFYCSPNRLLTAGSCRHVSKSKSEKSHNAWSSTLKTIYFTLNGTWKSKTLHTSSSALRWFSWAVSSSSSSFWIAFSRRATWKMENTLAWNLTENVALVTAYRGVIL